MFWAPVKVIKSASKSLYVHLPWCVKKCPYCDFNSHSLRNNLDEDAYIDALLNDLVFEVRRLQDLPVITSVFIGGGTPSLFSGASIARLIKGIAQCVGLDESTEITLEANPGTADESHFKAYRQAGINRLSIGVQSFNDKHLQLLGRIHGKDQAISAVDMAVNANFTNFNLDLMYALPQQSLEQAKADVAQAIALAPTHISAYQLTLEPNTLFAAKPPVLPNHEAAWAIQNAYYTALEAAGYAQYEISAYSLSNRQCLHNLNYWQFGDYLGIGAGAHGKLSSSDGVYRTCKPKHPDQYLQSFSHCNLDPKAFISAVKQSELPLEFMMNRLRLRSAFSLNEFENATGLNASHIEQSLQLAIEKELLTKQGSDYLPSPKGRLFLDDLLQLFLTDNPKEVALCSG